MSSEKRNFFAKSGDYFKESLDKIKSKKTNNISKEEIDFKNWAFNKFSKRRSCRSFSDKPVDEGLIWEIMDISLKSPCAGGIQNVYLIEVFDDHVKHDLARSQTEQTWISKAPVLIVVLSDKSEFEKLYPHDAQDLSMQNASAVTSSILYLSELAGLNACWVKAGDNDEVSRLLHFNSNLKVDSIIPIGYAGDLAFSKRDYIEPTERIYINHFGNRDKKAHH